MTALVLPCTYADSKFSDMMLPVTGETSRKTGTAPTWIIGATVVETSGDCNNFVRGKQPSIFTNFRGS